MTGLSKSRYTAFCQCPKNLWLKAFKSNEAKIDDALKARFAQGNDVGDLAMRLFGDYKEAHAVKPDGSLDLDKMAKQTTQWMGEGVENICEASFTLNGHYCAVDILRRNGDGWDIYEVKSSTYHDNATDTAKHLLVYTRDIAYQKWLLEQCGVKVNRCYLVRLDSNFVRGKEFDDRHLPQLFHIKLMDQFVADEYIKVEDNVKLASAVLQGGEPAVPLGTYCRDPYNCVFFDYCTPNKPDQSVFNLYRMTFKKKCELYNQGKIAYKDLVGEKLSDIQQLQVNTYLNNTQLVTPQEIRTFLQKLTYPLYFLDFETMQPAVPQFEGTRPYQQIPFQYSLHWIENDGGKLQHTEFLGDSVSDPRRALAEQLCKQIPKGVCTTAYNKDFECNRLKDLAAAYPDLSDHLLDISNHIVDLIEPFRKKMVYLPEMKGSFSIKQVLPALQPDDPQLNYKNLQGGVQNGGDAMTIYPTIAKMNTDAEKNAARQALLEYCKLDTLAMVKIWEKLREMAGI